MKSYNEWKKNKLGGMNPENSKQIEKFKKYDLITLPKDVSGTNCSNCKFVTNIKNGVGFCDNKKIKEHVTARNCCVLWDAKGVIRSWEN